MTRLSRRGFGARAGAAAALLALGAAVTAQAEGRLTPLIDPAALAERLEAEGAAARTLVIDIRAPGDYAQGHAPGAVNAPYGQWRGPAANPGAPLSDARLTSLLRGIGAESDRPTVVVHRGANPTDFGAAARVYWTLKAAGFSEIAILNGGVRGWLAAGLPVSREAVTPTPSAITAALSPAYLADRSEVAAIADGSGSGRLIDARPQPFYDGQAKHPAAPRAGTLKGADRLQHDSWFAGGGPAMTADAAMVRARLAAIGVEAAGEETLVSFCNTGHWAATNWFALSEIAGADNVKLYPGSMVDWTASGGSVSIGGR